MRWLSGYCFIGLCKTMNHIFSFQRMVEYYLSALCSFWLSLRKHGIGRVELPALNYSYCYHCLLLWKEFQRTLSMVKYGVSWISSICLLSIDLARSILHLESSQKSSLKSEILLHFLCKFYQMIYIYSSRHVKQFDVSTTIWTHIMR